MIRAVMEGICYSLNSVMAALKEFGDVKDIRVSGSFTKSKLWLQILSDVLNQPITLPDNSEGAAFGAAVLGFISSGKLKSIADTATWSTPRRCIRLWKKTLPSISSSMTSSSGSIITCSANLPTSRHISRNYNFQ